jgi:hypothetical protein
MRSISRESTGNAGSPHLSLVNFDRWARFEEFKGLQLN